VRIVAYNHDTSVFEFGLETGQSLSLPVCGCILMANVPVGDEAEEVRPVRVCCGVLQCVAVCCSVLLQCVVAVCCSV